MTRDDILRLCVEAGLYSYCDEKDEAIYRFAALVAAAERKACAEHYLGIMREAIKEEREACAKVCELMPWVSGESLPSNAELARAIRARGES